MAHRTRLPGVQRAGAGAVRDAAAVPAGASTSAPSAFSSPRTCSGCRTSSIARGPQRSPPPCARDQTRPAWKSPPLLVRQGTARRDAASLAGRDTGPAGHLWARDRSWRRLVNPRCCLARDLAGRLPTCSSAGRAGLDVPSGELLVRHGGRHDDRHRTGRCARLGVCPACERRAAFGGALCTRHESGRGRPCRLESSDR